MLWAAQPLRASSAHIHVSIRQISFPFLNGDRTHEADTHALFGGSDTMMDDQLFSASEDDTISENKNALYVLDGKAG